MNETITILLGTYNGEKYVGQQLESLIHQTYTGWRLLIRDDGSTDNTLAVINPYIQAHPGKIKLITNEEGNKGSLHNFSVLLQHAGDAAYIMFCDQDDVWKQDKTEITLKKMKALEQQNGTDCPVLIFTNFQYVDETMTVIESKKDFEINRIRNFGFPQLLAQNPVYGCTTMMNKALREKVGAIPSQADYHDHWVALVAAAFGVIYYLGDKTVMYRQHGNNVSGSFDNDSLKKRFRRILVDRKNMDDAKKKYTMLLSFKNRYGNSLSGRKKEVLNTVLCLYEKKSAMCLLKSIRYKVRSQTWAQSVLFYITALFTKPAS